MAPEGHYRAGKGIRQCEFESSRDRIATEPRLPRVAPPPQLVLLKVHIWAIPPDLRGVYKRALPHPLYETSDHRKTAMETALVRRYRSHLTVIYGTKCSGQPRPGTVREVEWGPTS